MRGDTRRYVVSRHEVRPGEVHWDLMIERAPGGMLATFKLAARPLAGVRVEGRVSFDHRHVYLEHEGPIPGDRGVVTIEEAGRLVDRSGSLDGDYEAEGWTIRRSGERVTVERCPATPCCT